MDTYEIIEALGLKQTRQNQQKVNAMLKRYKIPKTRRGRYKEEDVKLFVEAYRSGQHDRRRADSKY